MITQPSESMPDGTLANTSAIAPDELASAIIRPTNGMGRDGQLLNFNPPIQGSSVDDRLSGDRASDAVVGNNDIILGGDGDDRIRGRDGNDIIYGDSGDDRLRGDDGHDVLWGGLGSDRLIGDVSDATGEDVFVLERLGDTDKILDFQAGVDRIGLADGLTFDQLEFSQSRSATVIVDRASGDTLAWLKDVDVADMDRHAFVAMQRSIPEGWDGLGPDTADPDLAPVPEPVSHLDPSQPSSQPSEEPVADAGQPDVPESIEPDVAEPDAAPSQSEPDLGQPDRPQPDATGDASTWRDDFSGDWADQWKVRQKGAWGFDNFEVMSNSERSNFLRVVYHKDSASPSVSRRKGVPIGGGQFYADLDVPPQDQMRLNYSLRFSEDFDFVKGGKLPGLFGGNGASGGKIPDGTDGFSARLMWRRDGQGEVYAYLPTSKGYGTSIDRGAWSFTPGKWHDIEQEVVLNQPGQADGQVRVWVDDALVLEETGLTFRTTDKLKLDGIFFSTFFGGGDSSWATPKDVHIDFANFSVTAGQ